jgi:hypothetical protein
MKSSKSLLLGTAVALTISSFSVSAVTPDELANVIRATRTCPAAKVIQQDEPTTAQGWFSFFRSATGNFFRTAGDAIRTEGDIKSTAGWLKEEAKDAILTAISAKVGIALHNAKDAIFYSIGNSLHAFGQFIKGGRSNPDDNAYRVR